MSVHEKMQSNADWARRVKRAITAAAICAVAFGAGPASAGVVKICKVAGEGVNELDEFTFDVNAPGSAQDGQVVVKAGPQPRGYCWPHLQDLPDDAEVDVRELVPPGVDLLLPIEVVPANRKLGDIPDGVHILAGPGVTEVTFTNERRTGYIEICKLGGEPGRIYNFDIPGRVRTVPAPAGACSPPYETPASEPVTISEVDDVAEIIACRTIPADRGCEIDEDGDSVRVGVAPGGIAEQTIVMITNKAVICTNCAVPVDPLGGLQSSVTDAAPAEYAFAEMARPVAISNQTATTMLACAPHPSSVGEPIAQMTMCTARVTPMFVGQSLPTGMVEFVSGGKILAILPLKTDSTTTLALPDAPRGGEGIIASYRGDAIFGESASMLVHIGSGEAPNENALSPEPVDIKIYKPGEPAPNDNEAAMLNINEEIRLFEEGVDLHTGDRN